MRIAGAKVLDSFLASSNISFEVVLSEVMVMKNMYYEQVF